MDELISSSSNPLIKQIRALRQRKGREETGLFVVEGIHHVGEAVQSGWNIERLVYAPDSLTSDFARHLVDEQARRGVCCVALTADLFASITEKENPQGILAILKQRHLTLDELAAQPFHLGAALVSPQDPGNVGTILRTLDAVGADGLFLLNGGVDPYHPSSVRASMGTIFWKPLVQLPFENFVRWARQNSYRLIGTSAHAGVDYHSFNMNRQPAILLFGNEQKGLSQEQMDVCDELLSLPMKGRVSSLNLAVAAGIMLYAVMEHQLSGKV
jgi:TrmH family RNA methyltransferase